MRPIFLSLVCIFSSLAHADVVSVKDVSFLAVGPAGLKINGVSTSLETKEEGEFVVFRVPLDTLETGISLRDRHMKEKYLETQKFSHAELKVSKALLKAGRQQKGTGTFTVHGVSKPIDFVYDVTADANGLSVQGTFDINIKQFGIEVPSYLGVTVKPDVKVAANFVVKP